MPGSASEPLTVVGTCADCGKEIEWRQHPEGWVTPEDDGAWSYVCRVTYQRDGDHFKVIAADYHYIQGGTQKHLRAVDHDGN